MRHSNYIFRRILFAISMVNAVVLFAGFIGAQAAEREKGSLVGKMLGHKVGVDSKGRETLMPVTEVVPGDVIEYTLVYQNQDKTNALSDVVIASPIPPETSWILHSEKNPTPSRFEASINGGKKYQAPPILIKTTGPEGKEIEVEAPAERYTHLRWILSQPLSAADEVSATYRVYVK